MTNPTNRITLALRLFASLLFAAVCVLTGTVSMASEKPNILIIFTDDQGYADLACYGNENFWQSQHLALT